MAYKCTKPWYVVFYVSLFRNWVSLYRRFLFFKLILIVLIVHLIVLILWSILIDWALFCRFKTIGICQEWRRFYKCVLLFNLGWWHRTLIIWIRLRHALRYKSAWLHLLYNRPLISYRRCIHMFLSYAHDLLS